MHLNKTENLRLEIIKPTREFGIIAYIIIQACTLLRIQLRLPPFIGHFEMDGHDSINLVLGYLRE